VNISWHIAYLFHGYICSHSLVAPHGLQNLGGALVYMNANHVKMIIFEIQFHAYIEGELFKNFGVQKL
jgi:hypothetical protein